jgi:hypothetical protein
MAAATTFLPTDDGLSDELLAISRGKGQGTPIGGVILLALDADEMRFSAEMGDWSSDGVAADAGTRAIFEGYSPAAMWTLSVKNISPSAITTASIKFELEIDVANDQFRRKVNELQVGYEAELSNQHVLETVASIPLKTLDPDAFERLSDSVASVRLSTDLVPDGIVPLTVKGIGAQAVGKDGAGVEGVGLIVSRPSSTLTDLSLVSADGGFTFDATGIPALPLVQQLSLLGDWELRLSDPTSDFGVLEDIRLFFLYEFKRDS